MRKTGTQEKEVEGRRETRNGGHGEGMRGGLKCKGRVYRARRKGSGGGGQNAQGKKKRLRKGEA